MKPFQRFRKPIPSESIAVSSSNAKRRNHKAAVEAGSTSHASKSSRSSNKGVTPSAASSSHNRSRSVERRGERSRSQQRPMSSKTEKRQGGETWFDRVGGGSAVSSGTAGKRSKSVGKCAAAAATSRTKSRSTSRRRRSKSRERSLSRRRRRSKSRDRSAGRPSRRDMVPPTSNNNAQQQSRGTSKNRQSNKTANSNYPKIPEVIQSKSKSSPVNTIGKSNQNPSASRKAGKQTAAGATTTATRLVKQKNPSPTVGTGRKRSPPNSSAIPATAPQSKTQDIPAQLLPLAAPVGTPSSAFQRWPRLPNFRKKKPDDTNNNNNKKPNGGAMEIDQEKREHLLRMILGNTGSFFEDRSTLNAPRGEVMRTGADPIGAARAYAREQGSPPKTFAGRLVDAALLCEAMTAWPFIFIQTICCVQDDYLEPERAKLYPSEDDEDEEDPTKLMTTANTNPEGPPIVIEVKPENHRAPTPESVAFTTGSETGCIGFALGRCGDSSDDSVDPSTGKSSPITTMDESTVSVEKPPTPVVIGEIVDPGLVVKNMVVRGPTKKEKKAPVVVRASKISAWESKPKATPGYTGEWEAKSKVTSIVVQNEEIPVSTDNVYDNHANTGTEKLVEITPPLAKNTTSENPKKEHTWAKVIDQMSSEERTDDGSDKPGESKKKLEEWEAMEAKLKALLNQSASTTDENSITSD